MNEHLSQTPQDQEYESFPMEHASRVMYVKRTNGNVEGGWIATGSGVRGGVEYTRVMRSDGEDMFTKDIPTAELNAFDAEVREQKRLEREEKMGEGVVELAVAPIVTHEPFIEPEEERTLHTDELQALRLQVNAPANPELAVNNIEQEKNPRYEKLFQPLVRPELPKGTTNYGYMFEQDDDKYRQKQAAQAELAKPREEAQKAQRTYDRFVNEDTKRVAAEYVSRTLDTDPNFARIIKETLGDKTTEEVVDALREDADVRYDVGTYLLAKLDDLVAKYPHEMPDRILDNGQKNTDAKVMPLNFISSREYVAYLALAKLDGSFNGDLQTSTDGIDYDQRTGKVAQAQHRFTADFLLNNR